LSSESMAEPCVLDDSFHTEDVQYWEELYAAKSVDIGTCIICIGRSISILLTVNSSKAIVWDRWYYSSQMNILAFMISINFLISLPYAVLIFKEFFEQLGEI
jgi:hypothetical protein